MKIEDLKGELETNDISFSYNNKEYSICPLDKIYAGECLNDDDNSFDTFEEMINNWIVDGKKFKDIIKDIKLL
ncbi:hypothetical protein [Clostridium sp.]|uniref:hypothetical protein n=1 Tax=Clostridium sp. TaxID=1506 RepID=UPI0028FFDF42|nr:hypothetical protein [Clostridium sp.]MDU2283359.1 hypothetical protein [Clostridium sp.]